MVHKNNNDSILIECDTLRVKKSSKVKVTPCNSKDYIINPKLTKTMPLSKALKLDLEIVTCHSNMVQYLRRYYLSQEIKVD